MKANNTTLNKKLVKNSRNWRVMLGDSDLEKRLNSFLTRVFVAERDVLSDECYGEVRGLMGIPHHRIHVAKYLLDVFGTYRFYPSERLAATDLIDDNVPVKISSNYNFYWSVAGKVMAIISKHKEVNDEKSKESSSEKSDCQKKC